MITAARPLLSAPNDATDPAHDDPTVAWAVLDGAGGALQTVFLLPCLA